MTISKEERTRALQQAFRFMADTVGDRDFLDYEFDAGAPGLKSLPETTLKELEDYSILENVGLPALKVFRLTPSGWIKALTETGQLRNPETKERAGKSAAILKGFVKGRFEDELVSTNEVVSKAVALGLPEGWVWSALECSLLSVLWPSQQMEVSFTSTTCAYLHVPARFGMDDKGVIS